MGLGDMLPTHPSTDLGNMPSVDAEHIGDPLVTLTSGTESTNFPDIRFGERVTNGLTSSMPALGDHVANVVVIGSEEQMVGANTFAIIATMEDVKIARDRSKCQFPSNAVGRQNGLAADADHAVTVGSDGATPFPAITRPVYLLPKAFVKWSRAGFISAHGRTVSLSLIDARERVAAFATNESRVGILGTHFWSLLNRFRGAVPRAVSAAPRRFACLHFTRLHAEMGVSHV